MLMKFLKFLLLFSLAAAGAIAQKSGPTPVSGGQITAATGDLVTDIIPLQQDGTSRKTSIATEYYSVTFDSRGGQISALKHLDPHSKLKNGAELVKGEPFPFMVYSNPTNSNSFFKAGYRLSVEEKPDFIQVTASLPVQLKTSKGNVSGKLEKIFRFYRKMHYWLFNWKLTPARAVTLPKMYFLAINEIGPKTDDTSARAQQADSAFYYTDGSYESFYTHATGGGFLSCGSSGQAENKTFSGEMEYFGSSSRFMLASVQPLVKTTGLYYFAGEKQLHLEIAGVTAEQGGSASIPFLLYTGPKLKDFMSISREDKDKFPELEKSHPNLVKAFNFGVTAPIRDLIVALLNIFHKVVPNYGIGIILFALVFKLVFWPLNQKQADSMKKMQVLQPKLKELNEKYKDNPQEKQKRMMAMYKEHKINPLSGCLPMVIQLPIFFALYAAFSDSYELWRAPFIPGWIPDLSEPDTVYIFAKSLPVIGGMHLNILPLLMVITQFLQSKFTMVSGDASQQKIMQFMPLMMLFFFWNMPSGVVLYWTIQNILSVAQQLYTNARQEKKA